MKRVLVGLAGMAVGVATLGGTAFAAPSNSPRANEFLITCSNGTIYTAVAPPGGKSMQNRSVTPAIIVSGGKGVLIPTTITFSFPGFPPLRSREVRATRMQDP